MTEPLQTLTRSAYALAYQMLGRREDAMDIIQDAATVALSHTRAPARDSQEFKPWFFKVVRNRALDQLRRRQRFTHESLQQEEVIGDNANNPETVMEKNQLKGSMNKALMKVSIEQREIVVLKDYHGFNYAQIAQILGIPKGSVMSRLHRARLALRKILADTYSMGEKD